MIMSQKIASKVFVYEKQEMFSSYTSNCQKQCPEHFASYEKFCDVVKTRNVAWHKNLEYLANDFTLFSYGLTCTKKLTTKLRSS